MKPLPLIVKTFIGFLWLVAMAAPAAAAPDLVPILTTPPNGTVGVRNAGTTAAAGPTLLLVHCRPSGGGKCADIPPALMAAYSDPLFPDYVVVKVPALRPGQRFMHRLRFWNQLCWPAGSYQISARADGANSETESDEANNEAVSTLVSQRRDCPAGPDAKPDLVPISNDLATNGTAIVWNNGTVAAGPTKLLVSCKKVGFPGPGGGCPPIPPDQLAAYSDPAFPDQIIVRVPALQPRTRFDHHLTFWDSPCWPAGSYVFSARADVGNSEAEGVNEGNNYVESTLVSTRPNCPIKPQLRPILSRPPDGTVGVRNDGTAAGPSLLLVSCSVNGPGRCPPIPPAQLAAYTHPDFPNQVVVRVPALGWGERFVHRLSYWDQLCWPAGRYDISVTVRYVSANVANSVAQLVSQRDCSGVPRPPFDPSKPPHATPAPAPAKPTTPVVPAVPQPKSKQAVPQPKSKQP